MTMMMSIACRLKKVETVWRGRSIGNPGHDENENASTALESVCDVRELCCSGGSWEGTSPEQQEGPLSVKPPEKRKLTYIIIV